MSSDEFFMGLALKLAKKGLSWTNPNPLVGAVIVKDNRIISQGFHHQAGTAHAEIAALNACRILPAGGTLYVNLEPCSTFGKTPPCLPAIIKSKIKKVVCSTLDPNPKNHGQGIAGLQKIGIAVSMGILEKETRQLNEAFFTFHESNRPFIALKFAISLDGKLATRTNDSKWITNERARQYARTLRGQYQTVLIGINTVLADNPNLGTIRGKKDPIRIILDSKLQIPLNAQVLRNSNVIIAATDKADKKKKEHLEKMGITILVFEDSITIPKLLSQLREKEIISILVEGGGKTLGSFIDAKIIDKVYAFQAPILIGGEKATNIGGHGAQTITEALHLKNISYKKFNDNLLTTGYIAEVTPLSFVIPDLIGNLYRFPLSWE